MKKFTLTAEQLFNVAIQPNFLSEVNSIGDLSEFNLIQAKGFKATMVNLIGKNNILKNRDASCNVDFDKLGTFEGRKLDMESLYAATKTCDNEFYDGCLDDFRNSAPKFREFILDLFKEAIKNDIITNAYFGKKSRAQDPTGLFSWSTFNGVLENAKKDIEDGSMKESQIIGLDKGALEPKQAFEYLEAIYNAQTVEMRSLPASIKQFIVSESIYNAYEKYVVAANGGRDISILMNGISKLNFNNI